MAAINKPAQPLIAPTDVEEVEAIAGAAAADAIASDTTHAPLVNDLVPAANLPSYVDDVLEFGTVDAFPAEGEAGKIYVALDTNNTYRWADTTYVQVGGSEIDLTPYALKTEVVAALDTIADEVDNKQDKIHQIMLSAPTTREPTEHGAHMAGSLTADQIAEAREYYPNITVGLDENSTLGLPTSASFNGETGLEEVAWNRVQYEVFLEPGKKELCYTTIELDLEAATYDMWLETIPSEAAASGETHYLYLDVTINKPSGPGPIVVGSELEVTYFQCDDGDPNVWFPNDIGTAPVLTNIHLIVPADDQPSEESESESEILNPIVALAEMQFATLFYPVDSDELYDISEHRYINYNSEDGTISLNLATRIYQYRDDRDQLIYGPSDAPILVTPNQETDASAHFAAVEYYTNSGIFTNQFGILPSSFIYDGIAYTHMSCDGWDLSSLDPKAGEVLDLIRGEARVLTGIEPFLYLEDDGKYYWIEPIHEQLDLDDRSWHTNKYEDLRYCYRIRTVHDMPGIDFYYNPRQDIQLNLILNSDPEAYSSTNYAYLAQLNGPSICSAVTNDSSENPLASDFGRLNVELVQNIETGGYELQWMFGGSNGLITGRYWIDAETGDWKHSINWDSYSLPTASDSDSGVKYLIKYKLCPPSEIEPENFPPASWPTHITMNGAWDFINELTDTYYTVIGAGGACEVNDLNQITNIWGDITIYAYDDPKL